MNILNANEILNANITESDKKCPSDIWELAFKCPAINVKKCPKFGTSLSDNDVSSQTDSNKLASLCPFINNYNKKSHSIESRTNQSNYDYSSSSQNDSKSNNFNNQFEVFNDIISNFCEDYIDNFCEDYIDIQKKHLEIQKTYVELKKQELAYYNFSIKSGIFAVSVVLGMSAMLYRVKW